MEEDKNAEHAPYVTRSELNDFLAQVGERFENAVAARTLYWDRKQVEFQELERRQRMLSIIVLLLAFVVYGSYLRVLERPYLVKVLGVPE